MCYQDTTWNNLIGTVRRNINRYESWRNLNLSHQSVSFRCFFFLQLGQLWEPRGPGSPRRSVVPSHRPSIARRDGSDDASERWTWQKICVVSSGRSGGQGNKQLFIIMVWRFGLPAVYTVWGKFMISPICQLLRNKLAVFNRNGLLNFRMMV